MHGATVTSAKTVGAPKKVQSLVTTLKKRGADEMTPRCIELDTTRLTFLDGQGKKLATVSSFCGGYGDIVFENGDASFACGSRERGRPGERCSVRGRRRALGITSVEVSRPGTSQNRTLEGGSVKTVLGGFDLDAAPDTNTDFPRCVPTYAVSFKRGDQATAIRLSFATSSPRLPLRSG